MKVSEIIERLNRNYTPDTQLYVEWWDKDLSQALSYEDETLSLSDDEWTAVVEHLENSERLDQSLVAQAIGGAVDRAIKGDL
jgi:hypothetical protein